jgi:fucose permease
VSEAVSAIDRMETTENSPAKSPGFGAVFAVYGTALLIGLCVVSFPASGVYLMRVLGLSAAEYGTIFLPQLATTLAGAACGAALSGRLSNRLMLIGAIACFLLAETALLASTIVEPSVAIIALMLGTGIFGFGFGFGGGPINALAGHLFPQKANSAILALHGLAGVGFTSAPFLFGGLIEMEAWRSGPVLLIAVLVVLLVFSAFSRLPDDGNSPSSRVTWSSALGSPALRIAAAIVFLYALVEGMLANWMLPFLETERGFDGQAAALALSAFWGALTVGRLLTALFAANVAPTRVLIWLSLLLATSLILVQISQSLPTFIAVFALAGFGCSAFFPLLVGLSSDDRPETISLNASLLTGIMMAGTGIGAFGVGLISQKFPLQLVLTAAAVLPLAILALLTAWGRRSN